MTCYQAVSAPFPANGYTFIHTSINNRTRSSLFGCIRYIVHSHTRQITKNAPFSTPQPFRPPFHCNVLCSVDQTKSSTQTITARVLMLFATHGWWTCYMRCERSYSSEHNTFSEKHIVCSECFITSSEFLNIYYSEFQASGPCLRLSTLFQICSYILYATIKLLNIFYYTINY